MGLPAKIFVTLIRLSPASIQNRMWKWWYQKMAKTNDDSRFRFMNYGFEDGSSPDLHPSDEVNRLFIQLYSMNLRGTEIEGRDVLEVGSGRGGGASWVARSLKPRSVVGVDFSSEAVNLCSQWYADQDNLRFVEGNAEDLPFDDDSFDLVYNVESSHCYGDMGAFIEQVHRVLRKGGMFCWTDLRDTETMSLLPGMFESRGFEIVESAIVVDEVLRALDEINEAKIEQITKQVPKSIRKSVETFAGVKGTPVYEGFVNGSMTYHRHMMKKIDVNLSSDGGKENARMKIR
jgi:ubiquinone/menaquinone biosynthesis C-methylase UbiE